jgi:hypothetical protein
VPYDNVQNYKPNAIHGDKKWFGKSNPYYLLPTTYYLLLTSLDPWRHYLLATGIHRSGVDLEIQHSDIYRGLNPLPGQKR